LRKRILLSFIVLVVVLPVLVDAAAPKTRNDLTPELDVDVWVGGLQVYYVYIDLDVGDTIYVDIEVTSGAGINFFICDQENYNLWSSLQSASVYGQQQSVGSVSTSFSVPTSGRWYCVFWNDALLTSKHLEGYVGTIPIPLAGDFLLVIVGLVFVVVIGGVIWFGLKKTQGPKAVHYPQPMPPQQPYTVPSQPTSSNYCLYCGTPKQSSSAIFCSTCGRAFDGPGLG
jgi:hypothetical protein